MSYEENLRDTIMKQYASIAARRARIQWEINELLLEIRAIALHLEALQTHRRNSYNETIAEAFGLAHGPAIVEARNLRSMAKNKPNKTFMIQNGFLPRPPAKQPKKSKPVSAIGRIGAMQAAIRLDIERGLNSMECEVIKQMMDKLRKELDEKPR